MKHILPILLIFFSTPQMYSQCIHQIFHTSGMKVVNGTQVTVTSFGHADTVTYYCTNSTQPYLIGANFTTPNKNGSYTFQFSPSVASVQLNISGIHNRSIHKEIIILKVNGSHYKIPTAGIQNGCDSMAVLTSNGNITGDSLGYNSGWNNIIINGPISEIVVLDSVVSGTPGGSIFSLFISDNSFGLDKITACDSVTWIDGNTYTTSNSISTHTLINAAGCDSVVTIDLTINKSDSSSESMAACYSYFWPLDSNLYTVSGVYSKTYVNLNGCDSIANLYLTINKSDSSSESMVACHSYFWPLDSNLYTVSGVYSKTYVNLNGCDSIANLYLTINTVDTSVSINGFVLTSNAVGASYQWIDCENGNIPIGSAKKQSFTAMVNGRYAVVVSKNGCYDTSACYTVTGLGINKNYFVVELLIYPNPNNGNFTIDLNESLQNIEVEVVNILGEIVAAQNAELTNSMEIQFEGSSGLYFVSVKSKGKVIGSSKIIKK